MSLAKQRPGDGHTAVSKVVGSLLDGTNFQGACSDHGGESEGEGAE